jgi:hypothetical protein
MCSCLASSDYTSTTNSGSGGILNVPKGEIEIKLSSVNGICGQEHMFHWDINNNSQIPIPIRAGFTTAIDVICPIE